MSYFQEYSALSPCQWATMYGFLYFGDFAFSEDNGCEYTPTDPVIIETGQQVVWDTTKSLTGNVVIEENASLHITCLVLAGEEVSFHVKRGAILKFENAEIRRLCEDKRWGGIWVEGNRDKEQPDIAYPFDPEANYADPSVAGAVIALNTVFRGGATVIQDGRYGDPNNWDYFGGLVIVENSDFIDNSRGTAFMSYPFPSKSYFYDCDFIENEEAGIDGTMGITIWNTTGLQIESCHFENMDNYGIHGWDFGANISTGNVFSKNRRAIDIYSTFPLASAIEGITIGPEDDNSPPNIFRDNFMSNNSTSRDIIIESTDQINGINIQYNEFYNSKIPISIDGYARYDINNNSFYDADFGIRLVNTGNDINTVFCNVFDKMQLACVLAGLDNTGVEILDNDFSTHIYTLDLISPPSASSCEMEGWSLNKQ